MKYKDSAKSVILFVYNADSGIGNALLDYGKKYVAPSKYDCQLCMLSYGPFGMKKDWKKFTSDLPYVVKFLHKDELAVQYPDITTTFPSMIIRTNNAYEVLVDSAKFNSIKNLDDLKSAVMKALEK